MLININLLRVSPNSQYLEFSVGCPVSYVFNQLYISRYDVATSLYETPKDCSTLLQGTTNKEVMRIATSAFGTDVTMYKVEFGVTPLEPLDEIPPQLAVCSNVNFVYANMLNLILNLTNCCVTDDQYDKLEKNYIILYAHQEAMRLERYTEAEYFYDILWQLYSNCGGGARQINVINNPCNCN